MSRTAPLFLVLSLLATASSAQVLMQPTPAPLVTAENEAWFLEGTPIAFAGALYYPAGAQVPFNSQEMVRSGSHMGVPFYSRTTIEPYSKIFVPVAGGRMQPYERLRTGALTGTAASQPPALASPYDPRDAAGAFPQAAGAPALGPAVLPSTDERPVSGMERAPLRPREPVGTAGSAPQHVRIGGSPTGINAIFIRYQDRRWYSTGQRIEIDPARMRRVEDYGEFPVWRDTSREDLIYLATAREGTQVVPYSLKRQDLEGLSR